MLTWDMPGTRQQLNITASDAVQANGPLTLLHAIGLCQQSGALALFMRKARDNQQVCLHIVGVNASLEPAMEWDRFLVGPLLPKHRRLVEAFNLPVTPFVGMTVSVLFSSNNRSKDEQRDVRRLGPFPDGYSERFSSGLYHSTVDETPDLVLAINPGFSLYPTGWWPTLRKLQSLQVPIIATGYSGAFDIGANSNIRAVYEHQRSLSPQLDGDKLRLPGPKCKTLIGCLRSLTSRGNIKLHQFSASLANPMPSFNQECRDYSPSLNAQTVCSDLDGNAYLASKIGYKVRLASHQPFAYCDDPGLKHCQSSAVVSVFEPGDAVTESPEGDESVPAEVIRDDLYRMMRCHSNLHSRTRMCMESLIQQQSAEQLRQRFVMTHLLNTVLNSCEQPWDDE
jgi:hypothetical protein